MLKKKKPFKLKTKLILLAAIIYFIFPIDIIPDVLPGIGWGDDLVVLLASLLINYKDRLIKVKKKDKVVEGEIVE